MGSQSPSDCLADRTFPAQRESGVGDRESCVWLSAVEGYPENGHPKAHLADTVRLLDGDANTVGWFTVTG
jgi:hypothetical protein